VADQDGRAGRSAAWGVVALLTGGAAVTVWVTADSAGSQFPIWPAYVFGAVAIVALYMIFASLSGTWPADILLRRHARSPVAPRLVPGNTAAAAEPGPRVMCPLSPMELTRLFARGETQLQGESLVAQYKDQWRQVSATVEEVIQQNDYVISVSGKDSDQVTVTFFFKPDQWAARLRGLMRGDPVSVIGQVNLVDRSHVIFNHSELVLLAPPLLALVRLITRRLHIGLRRLILWVHR
jgi:hypothetical protein